MTTATTSYDAIVVGLGGMGSAAAYALAARGCRVLGLERHDAAHDRGSSHGGSRIIRQAYFEGSAYVPLLLRAYELWEKLAADSQREVYRITGGLFIGRPDGAVVSGSLQAGRQWGLPHEVLDAAEIVARFPNFAPRPADVALYEARAGFARPELTVRAHLELAEKSGATLRFAEPVLNWRETTAGVRVTTGTGSYTAGRLVICPGAWSAELLGPCAPPVVVQRAVMYWLDPVGGVSTFLDQPIFIYENASDVHLYGFPAIDGPHGGVKAAFANAGTPCTADTIDRVVRPEEIAELKDRVGELLPALAGACLRTATCMYANTPDNNFVIARHPESDRVALACGFGGHGFKFVPVVGEILADLTIDGTTAHPISMFDPARFADG